VLSSHKRQRTFAVANIKDIWLDSLVQRNRHGAQRNLRRMIHSFCGKIKMKKGQPGVDAVQNRAEIH
jgi:hypothetical protein